jgi:YHS domain-containing protein
MRRTRWISVAVFVGGATLLAGCKSEKPVPSEGAAPKAAPVTPTTSPATTQAAISQKTCPVMGGPIDPKVYTDYQGKRVYFCCPSCIDDFKKDPAKYLAKLK